MRWYLLPELCAPMPLQLAVDEFLLHRAISNRSEHPWIRIYESDEAWDTVGCSHQSLASYRKKTCKRLTGGGLVHHGNDVLFSIIASKHANPSFSSVIGSYRQIHEAVKAGWRKLDLQVNFYPDSQPLPRGTECFKNPIHSDLTDGRQKIAGGAQKRCAGYFLHEESIQKPVKLAPETFKIALLEGIQEVFQCELQQMDWAADDLKKAVVLARDKYPNLYSAKK